jgi:parallel beta-helix repeat protein
MKKQNIYSILLLSSLLLFVTQLSLAEANPYIIDDSTGGDCNLIGAWNSDTKTCTLTQDVNQATIQIVSDGVTLDGGGHTITPPGNGVYFNAVVYLSGRTNVTVENLKIVGQSDNPRTGVGLVNSQNNILRNISSSNNYNGIVLDYSDHNTLTGNNSSNNACFGIFLGHSTYNTLTGNTS